MPKTQTKNPHPIVKILSDLNLTPKVGEEVNEKTYLRALMSAINIIESSSKDKAGDTRSKMLRVELKRVRELHRSKDTGKEYRDHMGLKDGEKHKKGEYRERKTTISGSKLMGKDPAKDASPTAAADKPKLLPGSGKFNTDTVKPADVDKKQKDSSSLDQNKLNSIAKTVDSIALLLRRQFNLEKKQQRDSRKQQDKANKDARESKLETKPNKKTGGLPKAIAKPALGFFERIKKFFFNIVVGAGVLKLMEWLKDPANAEKITQFKDFLVNNAGWILGGLAAIALLPIAVGLVGVVSAVLTGLSLLGPLLPALPWILGAILIGAVAWWLGKKISRSITGGQVIGKERHENLERLRAAGIVDAKENSLTLMDPNGKGRMKVNMYGENSITGREWKKGDPGGKNWRPNLDLMIPEHAEWYAKNYGQEALDEKLAAHKSYRDTRASLIDAKEDMQGEIKELWKDKKKDHFADVRAFEKTDASEEEKKAAWKEARIAWYGEDGEGGIRAELQKQEADIRNKYGEIAVKIGDESEAGLKAVIDPNIKSNNIVPGPSTNNNGVVTVIDANENNTSSNTSGGSGNDNASDESEEIFSSTSSVESTLDVAATLGAGV